MLHNVRKISIYAIFAWLSIDKNAIIIYEHG